MNNQTQIYAIIYCIAIAVLATAAYFNAHLDAFELKLSGLFGLCVALILFNKTTPKVNPEG